MTFPWLPFFAVALAKGFRSLYRRLRDGSSDYRFDPLKVFGLAWLTVPLVFFSISGSKLPGYILPAVPGAIVITAIYFVDLLRQNTKWRIAGMAMSAATLGICVILLLTIVPAFAEGDSVKQLIAVADSRGYTRERVMNFHSTSNNAEFYAAGRLVRDTSGKQREYWAPANLRADIAALGGDPVIVLVRVEHLALLQSDSALDVEVLADNRETVITRVSLKNAA